MEGSGVAVRATLACEPAKLEAETTHSNMRTSRFHRLLRHGWSAWSSYVVIAVWLALIVAGSVYLKNYELAAAPVVSGVADSWPRSSAIPRRYERPTLLFFIHPKCPCTRASLHELERTLRRLELSAALHTDVWVIATVPDDADSSWLETDTVRNATELPGAQVYEDRSGVEAARFGATTSGTVMLFDAAGKRQYVGGVTVARGMEGANPASDALESVLRGQPSEAHELPTFGCRLCLPEESTIPDSRPLANSADGAPTGSPSRARVALPSAP